MLKANHMAFFRSHGILIARILMGGMFALAGLDKLINASGTASYMGSVGLPENTALAFAIGLFESILGLAIVFGKRVAESALLLGIFVVIVSFVFHSPSLWADMPTQKVLFSKNAAIVAGLLYIVAYGSGNTWKLDKTEV